MSERLYPTNGGATFRDGLKAQIRVTLALMRRESMTRFGQSKLGYVWAVLEPVMYIGVFIAMREFLASRVAYGDSVLLFIITGFLSFRMWKSIASRGGNSISSNRALLTYPMVKPLDTIFARVVLEALTVLVVIVIFYVFATYAEDRRVILDPVEFTQAVLAVIFLGSSVALLNGILFPLWPFYERIWGLSGLPLMLLSGIFFVPAGLPPGMQSVLGWNPVLHCIEWFRLSTYIKYDTILDKAYVFEFSFILIALSLVFERLYRSRLLQP